ncbi:cysteine hydrolase family protein [Glutamicibacter uratoxydans]|uniref:cysteine hydrolase family protein n=1 Tax=Glutamicibacter uratoxydans TaxID=43667 RepID=UPI001FE24D68|nr:cysteine hydrolase family protein [Glutamicibacter uratoxydans]
MAQLVPADLAGTALVVIDFQRGVLEGCHDAHGVVHRTAQLVEHARSSGLPVVWVQDHGDFPIGTSGWQLADGLAVGHGEHLIRKTYRDSFAETDLHQILQGLGVRRLLVAGAQSDYCIRTTTQAAAVHGYDVTLVSDCHTTVDAEFDGTLITAKQIIAHTNMYFSGLRYPGSQFGILTAAQAIAKPARVPAEATEQR